MSVNELFEQKNDEEDEQEKENETDEKPISKKKLKKIRQNDTKVKRQRRQLLEKLKVIYFNE